MKKIYMRLVWVALCGAGVAWGSGCGSRPEAEAVVPGAMSVAPETPLEVENPIVLRVNDAAIENSKVGKIIRWQSERAAPETDEARIRVVLDSLDYVIFRELWETAHGAAGSPISDEMVQAEIERFMGMLPEGTSLEDLLKQEAMSYEEHVENRRMSLFAARAKKQLFEALPEVPEEEVEHHYIKNRNTPLRPESVEARQIVVSADTLGLDSKQQRVQEALNRLQTGTDFGEVAWLYSDDDNRAELGKLGRVWRGSLKNKRFENTLFALPEGEISHIIREDGNYYILMVDKKYPAEEIPEETLRKMIRDILRNNLQESAWRTYQLDMLKDADIQFLGDMNNLKELYWRTLYPELAETKLSAP